MQYNKFNNFEYDECSARGACSVPPGLSAVQEVLKETLKECAYYISKLKTAKFDTSKAELFVINIIANTVSTTAYPENQILGLIKTSYSTLTNIRNMYRENIEQSIQEETDLPESIQLSPDLNLNNILLLGEKLLQNKYKNINTERKNYTELITLLIISLSANFSRLYEYGNFEKLAAEKIVDALNILNRNQITLSRYENTLTDLAILDREIKRKLYLTYKEHFGEILRTEVSHSTEKGKAILVSGSSLYDLKLLLESIKDKNIDIYTHDDLIIAHAFEEFKQYKNLKGNFGTCNEKCILDFATFPGAVLLTENSNINTEYLYRGRLFTTSNIIPKGVIGIKNHDYTPLINSALEAKGFAKGQQRTPSSVGYNHFELADQLDEITNKFSFSEDISRLIIYIGEDNYHNYTQKLKKNLTKKDFLISFNKNINAENSLYLNISNNIPITNEIILRIISKINISDNNLFFIYSKSDISIIPDLINLKKAGAKNVIVAKFVPNVINPSLQKFLQKYYGIRSATTPDIDLKSDN